jgi:hypothetical protein
MTVEKKVAQQCGLFRDKKAVQSKQSPIVRKFAQYGHPVWRNVGIWHGLISTNRPTSPQSFVE